MTPEASSSMHPGHSTDIPYPRVVLGRVDGKKDEWLGGAVAVSTWTFGGLVGWRNGWLVITLLVMVRWLP